MKKSFQELDLSNYFLFAEHSILISSDFRSVRLDVYATDETQVSYNVEAQNDDKVPKELIHFLGYMVNSTDEYVSQVKDDNINLLHDKVTKLKKRRELEAQYMTFEELVRSRESKASAAGKAEGKAEDILELLEDYGTISEELKTKVMTEKDFDTLKKWHKLAAKSGSVEEFTSRM